MSSGLMSINHSSALRAGELFAQPCGPGYEVNLPKVDEQIDQYTIIVLRKVSGKAFS
jgi:hypothetical protein